MWKVKWETQLDTAIKYEKMLNLMLSWKAPSYKPLSMKHAAAEIWVNAQAFSQYCNLHTEFKKKYEKLKEAKRNVIWSLAETNLEKALDEDNQKIDDLDKARLSLDYLKATEKAYNPRIEVEGVVKNLMIWLTDEEIKAKMSELMNK